MEPFICENLLGWEGRVVKIWVNFQHLKNNFTACIKGFFWEEPVILKNWSKKINIIIRDESLYQIFSITLSLKSVLGFRYWGRWGEKHQKILMTNQCTKSCVQELCKQDNLQFLGLTVSADLVWNTFKGF